MTGSDSARNKAAYTREGRKQLFAVLQSARGSSGDYSFGSYYGRIYVHHVKNECSNHFF